MFGFGFECFPVCCTDLSYYFQKNHPTSMVILILFIHSFFIQIAHISYQHITNQQMNVMLSTKNASSGGVGSQILGDGGTG
jgi:hypothetical protein